MFVVKIGGSVITDKKKKDCFRHPVMDRLAREMHKAGQPLVLVHGAGSFGHILAKHYELNQGYKQKDQLLGFAQTHAKVQTLNSLVLQALQKYHIPAVSLAPHMMLQLNNHKLPIIDYTFLDAYIKLGFTVVTFGDVALDKTTGFSICSGDLLVHALASHLKPEHVVFVIDEDGLYTANPKLESSAKFISTISAKHLEDLTTTADKHADVTEGMRGKINTIQRVAHLGVDTVIVNGNKPQRLYNVLRGKETICTRVLGMKQ